MMNLFCPLPINNDPQTLATAMLTETEWADLLEKYIAWLATEYDGPDFHLIAHHFGLSGYRRQLQNEVQACKLGASEASHSYFIAVVSQARKLREVILNNNVSSARIRCLTAAVKSRENRDNMGTNDLDEDLLRGQIIAKHTEKFRELLATTAT